MLRISPEALAIRDTRRLQSSCIRELFAGQLTCLGLRAMLDDNIIFFCAMKSWTNEEVQISR